MTEERVESAAARFAAHRSYLFAVAYRMLGSAADAEDVVQDAWLRFQDADASDVERPRAYLLTIVTRLCVDLLRSTRQRREEYVGVWLPEPVPTQDAFPEELAARAESASFAFLLLLERLSPLQRAVLVLHEVCDYSHDDIAAAIGRTASACRQILRRARLNLGTTPRPVTGAADESRAQVERFFEATRSGDVEALIRALAPDVTLLSDGGGRVVAVPRPLAGSATIGRFLGTVGRKSAWNPVVVTELNGQSAALTYERGVLTNALLFDATREGVTAIYVVRNPDKLGRLDAALPTPESR